MALKRLIFPSFLVIAIIFSIIPAKAVITLEAEPLSSSIQEPVSTTATSSIISTTPATTPATHKIDLAKISADLQAIQSLKSSGSPSVLVSKLETDFNQVKSDLTAIKSDLSAKNLSSKILERLDNFSQSYTSRIQKIIDALKSAAAAESLILEFTQIPEISKKIYNPHPFRVIESPGTINKVPVSEFPKTNLPAPSDALKKLINSTTLKNVAGLLKVTSSSPSLSTAPNPAPTTETVASVNSSPTPADLAETEEIKFTQNIKNLATSLNSDPLTIFNYVSNNLDFIPYFGSKKGADATLVEKAGNDFDQASLLIALLRVGDQNSQNKTPARYKQATVKLDLGRVMDLLGVEDPVVAATVLEKTDIPYVLYVDQNQTPLFFVVELTYVEAYVDYDYTRGVIQGTGSSKRWVPLVPSLAKFYKSQYLNAPDAMNLNIQTFYDNYLNGTYGVQKPIDALKTEIQNYLSANQPDLAPEDTLTQTYRSEKNLEFLPLTPPFEIVSALGAWSAAPDNLKQKITFLVQSDDETQTFLNTTVNVSSLADQELILDYVAASPADQAVIDSFPSIYDVVPLSLVNLKPVLKINGAVQAGGGASDPEIQMGRTHQLKIIFKNPDQTLGSAVMEKIAETVEKSVIVGNSEGIGISTDRVAPPETRPNQDTSTTSPAASQKLYRTALNYLYRLESSHDELARIFGARFTNTATRAVVFNGIDVNYQSGEPYSFSWKGLRIDSSSAVNYYSHFSENPNLHQKEFMYVFGLQASQDEADIFENDFQVASISTVKGLKLINQNQIPGVQVRKISSSNLSDLESLNISDATKTKLRDSVHAGHIVYVPSQPFTYQNWTGLVYIDIDPSTGFGGYIIGEGLNGGYTVEQWPEGWQHFWRDHLISNLTATIQSPTANQEFIRGVKIPWRAYYRGDTSVPGLPNEWYDVVNLDTSSWTVGTTTLWSGYGTTASVQIRIKSDCKIGKENCDYDDFILKQATSTRYGMPPGILKAIIEQETKSNPFNPRTSRYEPKRDFQDFSGSTPNVAMTSTVPYSYFTLSGQNSSGQAVATGSKVYSLPRDYKTTLKNTQSGGWQLRGIITTDRNGDGILTFQEVYENDRDHTPGSQNWPTSTIPSLNFTPQFLLSSSYGLGHVMYKEATEAKNPSNNLIMKTTYTPHDIVNKPELGIELAASILKGKFDHLVPNDNCNGWSQAVRDYNGNSSYAVAVCGLYTSKYK